ncbi:bifunctional riboflavin kinase/FAD synthetase [Candidatus Saganbacteria bacterium]|nr:bifunctional riboflavin kinase/FAD synthetase [Candidatus Saganbacteria bacterium]
MSIVALGTFDGVHLGHQKVINEAITSAKKLKTICLAMTFAPHPQQVIAPERGLKLLTDIKERKILLCQLGVAKVVVMKFSRHLRRLSAAAFVKRCLVDRLGVRQVFVGFDFAFGQARGGDVASLKHLGQKYGFQVHVVPAVKVGHYPVKSSVIRQLISQGGFTQAIKLLGHPYQLSGKVVRGAGRGTKLGFPTANMRISPDKLLPAPGVYAGLAGDKKCAVNIGRRPTFGAGQTLVEAHLLDFHGSLRGKKITVALFKRLRAEKQFADAAQLKKQISRDINRVKLL